MADRRLSTSDLAARWDVSTRTITRYVRKKRLQPIGRRGLGGEFFFDEEAVQLFERENNFIVISESS